MTTNHLEHKRYWGKTIASFLLVLFTMPLGHALMRIMETSMTTSVLHYSAFAMGAVGLAMVIYGVFVKNDTAQTLWGLFGGLLFWTGWIEFLLGYYATRYGAQYDLIGNGIVTTTTQYLDGIGISHETLINGVNINEMTRAELKAITGSRPEYLMMPASFGFWVMFMVIYIFNSKSGCLAYNWLQKVFFKGRRDEIVTKSMTRHTSITTFLELNVMMWSLYLLLMFCYDPVFLGDSHPITLLIAIGCLVGSFFMFKYQLKLGSWGANIRMAISTVLVFWTTVEIASRNKLMNEIWVEPMNYIPQMITILVAFLILAGFFIFKATKKKTINSKH